MSCMYNDYLAGAFTPKFGHRSTGNVRAANAQFDLQLAANQSMLVSLRIDTTETG